MKDIKSFLIGFLSCTCLFLFMGQTSEHTHSAKDIEYNFLEFGAFNSLQARLQEIDDKADEEHSHYKYAPSYHSHSEYAPSYHSHY